MNGGILKEIRKVAETPDVGRAKLLEDLQERHEAVMDAMPVTEDDPIRPYCDGQVYVLERLISDVNCGLWPVAQARSENIPPTEGWKCKYCGKVSYSDQVRRDNTRSISRRRMTTR